MTTQEIDIGEPVSDPVVQESVAYHRNNFDKFDIARQRYDGLYFAVELFKLPPNQAQANAQNIITVADAFAQYIAQQINVAPSQPAAITKA
jgi:hypothetical protein